MSADQVRQAEKRPNIEYRQGTAEAIDVEDSAADLVTVAQALHW